MTDMRDEFLSQEDLDLRNLTHDELIAYWNLWLHQAQATNDLDEALYSHGVFAYDPAVVERQKAEKRKAEERATDEAYARHPDSPDVAFDPAVWEESRKTLVRDSEVVKRQGAAKRK